MMLILKNVLRFEFRVSRFTYFYEVRKFMSNFGKVIVSMDFFMYLCIKKRKVLCNFLVSPM